MYAWYAVRDPTDRLPDALRAHAVTCGDPSSR
jgi:hypothetical protein